MINGKYNSLRSFSSDRSYTLNRSSYARDSMMIEELLVPAKDQVCAASLSPGIRAMTLWTTEKGEERNQGKEIMGLPHCGFDPAKGKLMEVLKSGEGVFKELVKFLGVELSVKVSGSIRDLRVTCVANVLW